MAIKYNNLNPENTQLKGWAHSTGGWHYSHYFDYHNRERCELGPAQPRADIDVFMVRSRIRL
jgi:hypothetical protein